MGYLPSKLGKHAPSKTLRLICQVCGDKGWVQAAPADSGVVGTFAPVPCFNCSGGKHE
jgi:hypothetical protein